MRTIIKEIEKDSLQQILKIYEFTYVQKYFITKVNKNCI